jgi:hypothetical protein
MTAAGAGASPAQELCGRLTIPAELGLACRAMPAGEQGVIVAPTEGAFAALSRLRVRPLDRASDAEAWTNPDEWLRRQLEIDTSGIADAIERFADDPDSPWGGPTAALFAETVRDTLASVGRAALDSCTAPADVEGGRAMSCRLGAGPIGLLLDLRLVAAGDARWGIEYRSMNPQRQRHFEAIANSFRPA